MLHQLNWVRAVAALLVALFHVELLMGLPSGFGIKPAPLFDGGYCGVQIFFVLSGFVIAHAHRRDREGDVGALATFAWKRFRRIYPTLWIVLLLIAVLGLFGLNDRDPSMTDWIAAFLITPVQHDVVLSAEWTLRHEVLFYAVFAVFLWNRVLGGALLLAWGFAGSWWAEETKGEWLFEFLLNPNHALFLFGMGVAYLHGRGVRVMAPLALGVGVLVIAWTWSIQLHRPGGLRDGIIEFGIGAAILLYGLVSLPELNVRVRWLETFGDASYALYLLNLPIILLLLGVLKQTHGVVPMPLWAYFLILAGACQAAALGFHRWVERPVLAAFGRVPEGHPRPPNVGRQPLPRGASTD